MPTGGANEPKEPSQACDRCAKGLPSARRSFFGLDSDDLILLLILFLLYRESGDEDFLIILLVMLFM